MSYRDDVEAARARQEALARELAGVEEQLREREGLEARARDLRLEVADAAAQVQNAKAHIKLPLFGAATIATPCRQPWTDMVGDDRTRFCGKCAKKVYDLSELTAAEAEALLAAGGEVPCLRIHRRPDGTVITSDCPESEERRRRKRIAVAAGLLVAGSLGVGATLLVLPDDCQKLVPRDERHTLVVVEELPGDPQGQVVQVPERPEVIVMGLALPDNPLSPATRTPDPSERRGR